MEEGVEEDAYERVDRKEGAESSITKELDLASAWKCNCSEGHCAGKNNVWRVTDSVRVRADFESGNVSKAEPGSEGSEFDLCIWTAPDNEGTRWEARSSSWFYFVVTSFYEAGSALTIQVKNLNNQRKLFTQGHRPVYRSLYQDSHWRHIDKPVRVMKDERDRFSIAFPFRFDKPGKDVAFAFAYPFSLSDHENLMRCLEAEIRSGPASLYFRRHRLCMSLEGRHVDLLTITEKDDENPIEEALHDSGSDIPDARTCRIQDRQVFILTARVHPGETPSSHMLNGALKFLVDKEDPRASALRRKFVFKVVPILNPDGVAAGNYRMDTRGVNLNRTYQCPDPDFHPTVHAVRSLAVHFAEKGVLSFHVDLHGHANKRGCFAFGNSTNCQEALRDRMAWAKLISINNPDFDMSACELLTGKNEAGTPKEGSARVAIGNATGLTHVYTVECNYNASRLRNTVVSAPKEVGSPPNKDRDPQRLTIGHMESLGRSILVATLDLTFPNKRLTRLQWSEFRNLQGLKEWANVRARVAQKAKGRMSVDNKALPMWRF